MFYNLFEAHDQVSHKLVLTTKIKKETKQNNLEKGVFLIFELAILCPVWNTNLLHGLKNGILACFVSGERKLSNFLQIEPA